MTRILIKNPKRFFVYTFSSLCHRCKRGGDQPVGTSCILVVVVELTLAAFCNFFMLLHHFSCGAQHLFPMRFLLHTYKHTIANTKKTHNCNF